MTETLEFKAELKQLLHIITHSLYTHREIFLRELISNASDAIHKIRFDALSRSELLQGDTDWAIRVIPQPDDGTLTIADNGIGMSRQEVIDNLGTVAQSGTKAFLEAMKAAGKGTEAMGLIGQFGVGFYSAFMVADRVTVRTRRFDSSEAVCWQSDGQGTYTVETCDKPQRGTEVILHLKEDAKEFLEPLRLRELIRKYSNFIEFPVILVTHTTTDGQKKTSEEIVNRQQAIWLRRKSEVSPQEYEEFYKALTHDTEPPAEIIHFAAEGKHEFKVLAFIPAQKPFGYDWREPRCGLRLYIQRVLIMERCEKVLPFYLRFVEGVVDSSELPLNVSREQIQEHPLLDTIQKSVVKNVLDTLAWMKSSNYEKYLRFYKNFGSILKEGLAKDWNHRDKIADLLLFESLQTPAGQYITLEQYLEKMPSGQEAIYYLLGESAAALRQSPHVEAFRAKGYDILLLTDAIDAFVLPYLSQYRGKRLIPADRVDSLPGGEVPWELRDRFASFVSFVKDQVPEVAEVRLSSRLTESAACLVHDQHAVPEHVRRLLERLGQEPVAEKRILELNPQHPAVAAAQQLHQQSPQDPRLADYARLLYEQALVVEGSPLPDAQAFLRRLNALMARDATTVASTDSAASSTSVASNAARPAVSDAADTRSDTATTTPATPDTSATSTPSTSPADTPGAEPDISPLGNLSST
jgi:molecular chaperone HtpG